tara:strand:+ start:332 stop:523 length:192 start_codon:yes stop_codon:yes gene_type:complete
MNVNQSVHLKDNLLFSLDLSALQCRTLDKLWDFTPNGGKLITKCYQRLRLATDRVISTLAKRK